MAKNEKLPGLYKGIGPTLLAIAPFVAIQQITYDLLKHRASAMHIEPGVWLFLACGSLAGTAAQTVCYDVLDLHVDDNYMYTTSSFFAGCVSTRSRAAQDAGCQV